MLIEQRVITQAQLEEALASQKSLGLPLGETLIQLQFATPSQIFPVLESQMNVPWVDLSDGSVDPRVVPTIPQEKAERHGVLALFRVRDQLTVAMCDPRAIFVIDELEQETGLRLLPVLVSQTDVRRAIARYYAETAFDENVESPPPAVGEKPAESSLSDPSFRAANVGEVGGDASPLVNLVNVMLCNAVREHASDVHVEPGLEHISVRYRIDGELHEVMTPKLSLHAALISRLKVMTRMDIAERRRPQDGRTMVAVEGRQIDVRASCMPTVRGEKMALRLLDRESATLDFERLGMGEQIRVTLRELLAKPNGMILVTGPTGSGKTTSLYAMLNELRGVSHNVVSVEDPVEYELEYVNQVQVNEPIGLTFASILRTILRQDPDYIMVGEIRDLDTAKMAIQSALTGHLVLTTLHTNDAVSAVTRLINIGVDAHMVGASLNAVMAQRLVRTVCPKCAAPDPPASELLTRWGLNPNGKYQFRRGAGCPHCYGTGLRGRVGVYELLVLDETLRAAVARDEGLESLRRLARRSGMAEIAAEGIALAAAGRTTMNEILSVITVDAPVHLEPAGKE